MKDKIILENVLLVLKGTLEVYIHGSEEAVHTKVYNTLKDCLNEVLKLQAEVYSKMTECGWYKVKNVKNEEIQKTYTKLNSN